jgi:hypothetical protein
MVMKPAIAQLTAKFRKDKNKKDWFPWPERVPGEPVDFT